MRLAQTLNGSSDSAKFGSNAQIYPFTTERLDLSLQALPIGESRVCTVNGSGDQIINLALLGAREILSFDCNCYALWWAELKLIAIRTLSYKQFCQFFFVEQQNYSTNSTVLSAKTYCRLRSELSLKALEFFDAIFLGEESSGLELRTSSLFTRRRDNANLAKRCNLYLQSSVLYDIAQQQLSHVSVSFLQVEAERLCFELEQGYDLILLSNLADYAHFASGSKVGALEHFVSTIILPLSKKLNSDGVLAVAYIYETQPRIKADYRSEVDHPEIRDLVLKKYFSKVVQTNFSGVAVDTLDALITVSNG